MDHGKLSSVTQDALKQIIIKTVLRKSVKNYWVQKLIRLTN